MRTYFPREGDLEPHWFIIDAEGKILGRHVGYADYSELSTLLAKAPPRQDAKPNAPPPSPQGNAVVAQARADFEARKYAECLRQCNLVIAALPASPEANEARQLSQQIALDPVATRLVKDQINSGLTSLQTKLAAALGR